MVKMAWIPWGSGEFVGAGHSVSLWIIQISMVNMSERLNDLGGCNDSHGRMVTNVSFGQRISDEYG